MMQIAWVSILFVGSGGREVSPSQLSSTLVPSLLAANLLLCSAFSVVCLIS